MRRTLDAQALLRATLVANTMSTPSLRIARSVCLGLAVVAAPGCHKSRPATSAPAVSREDLEQHKGEPIEKQIQAKSPGVVVSRTADGGIAVQIRGSSSIMSSNEPLYVIDDIPIRSGPNGALVGINPYEIESISVLKNPEDTAIYGSRGANGVILIRTKKPGKKP